MGHLKKNSLHIFRFSLRLQERDNTCSSQEKYSSYPPEGRGTVIANAKSLGRAPEARAWSTLLLATLGHRVEAPG